jgi:hypothetical protein
MKTKVEDAMLEELKMKRGQTILLGLLLLLSRSVCSGAIVYVDQDAPGWFPNGSSWSRAYASLQDGLAAARFGDEIRVANGTYKPDQGFGIASGDREASFIIFSGVHVVGGFAGYGAANPNARDVEANPTILSGDLNGDDQAGGLYVEENSFHVVSAFVLGWDATLDGLTITGGTADGDGNDRFGAGLYVEAGAPAAAGVLNVKHCTIRNNTAVFGGGVASMSGIANFGGTRISGNRALAYGGALYADDSHIDMVNALLTGNTCDNAPSLGSDAIYSLGSSLTLASCTLADNGPANGKAIANVAWASDAAHTTTVTNSILHNGGNEIWGTKSSIVSVEYSNIKGGYSGVGNINSDPLFVDPGARDERGQWIDGDYTLQASSPSIDSGDQLLLPVDHLDLDEDGNTEEPLPVDLARDDRAQGKDVDQGAYEHDGSGTEPGPEPEPGPGWLLVAEIDLVYDVPASPPTFPVSVTAVYNSTIATNFTTELAVLVEATSPAGGDWSDTHFAPDPNPVPPGISSIRVKIIGEDFMPSALPPNSRNYEVAVLQIYARPAEGAQSIEERDQGVYVLDAEPPYISVTSE